LGGLDQDANAAAYLISSALLPKNSSALAGARSVRIPLNAGDIALFVHCCLSDPDVRKLKHNYVSWLNVIAVRLLGARL
jgi:hypothetical protein